MKRVVLGLTLLVLGACHTRNAADTARSVRREREMPRLSEVDFVQLRWAVSSETGQRYIDPNGTPVVVSDSVVLDMAGIDSVWVSHVPQTMDRWDVVARLSRPASARIGASSATHLRQQLAVIVDDRVTELPIVTGTLGSRVQLLSGVARPSADSLAKRIEHAIALLKPWQPVELHPR